MRRGWLLVALVIAAVGCKKKVDMILPDSGAATTTTAAKTADPTPSASAGADDTAPPLATLAPTKAPPVVVAKPAGSGKPAAGGANPPECDAAKVMLANGRQKEYESLKAACLSKGGKL